MGTYFYVPSGNGRNYYIPAPGTATFNFTLAQADNFVIWGKVRSLSDNNQGHYVYNNKGTWFSWQTGIQTDWTWVKITDNGAGVTFPFAKGANSFKMAWLHENAQLDQIIITNDLNFAPVQSQGTGALSLYPNPVTANFFTIQYTSSVNQVAQVTIFDSNSTLMKQTTVNLNAGANNVIVDVNFIYNGPYVVNFQPTTGQKLTTRIVINH